MSNISYDILYTPVLPLQQEPVEYINGKDNFKIRFDISVGNSIEDFNSGLIRIKNSKTENNVLIKQYAEQVIPFTNSNFGSERDLIKKEKINLPIVEKDDNGYYILLNQNIFGSNLLVSNTDIKNSILNQNLSVQISLTKDVLASGYYSEKGDNYVINNDGTGTGSLFYYNFDEENWQHTSLSNYFNGDILAKGISSWSAVSTLNILTETKYKLVHPENEKLLSYINSPITEFYGIREENAPIDNVGLKLKQFKIQIFNNELEDMPLIEDSGWIKSNGVTDLEIVWQNTKELVDKHNYLVRLKICNYFNLYKDFDYNIKTNFQKSDFSGELKVVPNYDLARNEIELKIKSPILWGPGENVDFDEDDFIKVEDGIKVENGINLNPTNGNWSGEFIFSGITPTNNWEENGNDFFLKIQTSEPTLKNPYQFMYTVHALSTPTSYDVNYGKKDNLTPYEDDIIWNPVISSCDDIHTKYQLFLDSSDDLYDSNDIDTEKNNRVLTLGLSKTKKEKTLDVLYVREYDVVNESFKNKWWEISIDSNGDVQIKEVSFGVGIDFTPKPIYLYDPIKHIITEMGVTLRNPHENISETESNYRIYFDDIVRPFIPGRSKRPTYINEFRLVKRVFSITSGTKNEITKQTYRAYLTAPNQKLMDWKLIGPDRKYYLQVVDKHGQIRLNVADVTEYGKETLDRYNAMNSNSASLGILTEQLLTMRGLDGNSYMVERTQDGRAKYFNLSVDAMGIPDVDYGYLSPITITYEPLLNKDIGLENIQNGGVKKDEFIDFDEIVADVVIDDELVLENYTFTSIDDSRSYYKEKLIEFASVLQEEKKYNDSIILFSTDQHYFHNRLDHRENVVDIYEKQYDSIDCMVELSHMVDIDMILLGGDNIDGNGYLIDAKTSLQTVMDKLKKKNDQTTVLVTRGNHDINTIPASYGHASTPKDNKIDNRYVIDLNKFNNEFLFNRKDYGDITTMPNNVWVEDYSCGYSIVNNVLYLSVDTSDLKETQFSSKNQILLDPHQFHGHSVSQLNHISNILKQHGNEVNSIVVIAHIPSSARYTEDDYIDHPDIGELNLDEFEKLLRDYNNGFIHSYNEEEDGTAMEMSTIQLDDSYAKITLCLHGHNHYDKLEVIDDIPHLRCCSALNASIPSKTSTLGDWGWIERVNKNSYQRTSFKAIIWNSIEKTYKVLNFGYNKKTGSNKTIDNKIIKGGF